MKIINCTESTININGAAVLPSGTEIRLEWDFKKVFEPRDLPAPILKVTAFEVFLPPPEKDKVFIIPEQYLIFVPNSRADVLGWNGDCFVRY